MESQPGQWARCRGLPGSWPRNKREREKKKKSLPLGQCRAGHHLRQYLRDQKASHRGGGSPCPEIVLRGLSTKTHAQLKRWMVSGGSWQRREIIVMCPRDDLPRSPGTPFVRYFYELKPGPLIHKSASTRSFCSRCELGRYARWCAYLLVGTCTCWVRMMLVIPHAQLGTGRVPNTRSRRNKQHS